jgi:competence ComEA-like helix-hairpin-helix protein
MLRLRHWIKEFFGFSRSQVNGFIILLPLLTCFIFSEPVWRWWVTTRTIDRTADQLILDSLVTAWSIQSDNKAVSELTPRKSPGLFSFNPNEASVADFDSLGFSQKLASRIVNYRTKGGKFRIKSDLLKIYGFDSAFYYRLQPYIALPVHAEKRRKIEAPRKKPFVPFKKEVEKFNLNEADTADLKKIYGIGEKLSLRILKYRDVLGGFIDIEQLREVYGLDTAVVHRMALQTFIAEGYLPVRINLNTATEKQLASHPYLNRAAKAIVAYRFQHGEFKTLEDIRNVGSLEENTVQKIIPYLKLTDE